MRIDLYICMTVGIILSFYLLGGSYHPIGFMVNTSANGTDITSEELSFANFSKLITENIDPFWGAISVVGVIASLGVLALGGTSLIPMLINVGMFGLIVNLFALPTSFLVDPTIPAEVRVILLIVFNSFFIMAAIEMIRR